MWGTDQLTPIPIYGDSLSYQTKVGSKGDGTKVYICWPGRTEGNWVSIEGHIQATAPGLLIRECHVSDYRLLWQRAEVRHQQYTKCRVTLFHDDRRIGRMWWGGETEHGGWEAWGRTAARRCRKRGFAERERNSERVADKQGVEWWDTCNEEELAEHSTQNEWAAERNGVEEGKAGMAMTQSEEEALVSSGNVMEQREEMSESELTSEAEMEERESSRRAQR